MTTQPTTPAPLPSTSAPAPVKGPFNGFGLAAVILGALGLAIAWVPFIGLLGIAFGLVGVVLGIVGLALQRYTGRRVLAIVGTALSAFAIIIASILPWITGAAWVIGVTTNDPEFRQELESQFSEFETEWESEFGTDFDEGWNTHDETPEPTPSPTDFATPTAPATPAPTATPSR